MLTSLEAHFRGMYSADLAHIHDQRFGDFAEQVAPEIVAILKAKAVRSGLVVEVGCGSGGLACHLTRRGYGVYGVDISPAMIRMARAKAPSAKFRVGSLASTRVPRCAAVVGIGEVVTYLPRGLPALKRFSDACTRRCGPAECSCSTSSAPLETVPTQRGR